jgi:PIN like domain
VTPDREQSVEFFIDRSLGKSIAHGLRRVGLTVHTMASVYGERRAQRLADEVWLRDVGARGWVVLTKDDAIRRRPAERDALIDAGVRVFCLTTAQLRGEEQVERFAENRNRILARAREPGPYIYGVYSGRIARLWPKS